MIRVFGVLTLNPAIGGKEEKMERQMISCFKGLAPISVPEEWLENFDTQKSFASVGDEARIKFPNGKAFGISISHSGSKVSVSVRGLSTEEVSTTSWGPFCSPWEVYKIARFFGHGRVTELG